ncbi:unnamed protein product [Ostreobium quekettii]|uniref:Uncharacterized protein n=1 Tax=Ostreobium quekettii TaxID=121088 RepID=A0A8S1J2C1_9CHLO|nr:unnamed protein product [Ostreobium quekettii]
MDARARAKAAVAIEGARCGSEHLGPSLNVQPCWRTPFADYSDPGDLSTEDPAAAKAADEIASLLDDLAMGPRGSLTVRLMRCLRLTMHIQHLHLAYMLSVLGCCLNNLHRHAEAETVHRRALSVGLSVLGMDHPNLADSIEWLAFSLFRQGNFKEAVLLCYTMTVLVQRSVGQSHPDMANCMFNLATVVDAMGLGAHAADLRCKGLGVMDLVYGPQCVAGDSYVGGWDAIHSWQCGSGEFDSAVCDEPYWVLAPHYADKVPDAYAMDSLGLPNCWYDCREDLFMGSGGSDESCSTVDVQFGTHCPEDILEADRDAGISFWGAPGVGV